MAKATPHVHLFLSSIPIWLRLNSKLSLFLSLSFAARYAGKQANCVLLRSIEDGRQTVANPALFKAESSLALSPSDYQSISPPFNCLTSTFLPLALLYLSSACCLPSWKEKKARMMLIPLSVN